MLNINIIKIKTDITDVTEIKTSQAFISKIYDDLSIKHQKLLHIDAQQKKISTLKSQAADLKNQGFKEIENINGLEQYGRRQYLEIADVPQQLNENTNLIVIEVAKLLNVVVPPDHISMSHRLLKKPNHRTKDANCSPSIVV